MLQEAAGEVVAGAAQVVLVEGPAGIGKTALLRSFVRKIGPQLLWASGDELEATLPYGVVSQLINDLRAQKAGSAQGDDLPPPPNADPLAVGAVLLEALSGVAKTSPLTVVIDDAHWADAPSLQALTFALRRLRHDPVLALLGTRLEAAATLPSSMQRLVDSDMGRRIELGGLDDAAIAKLCDQLGLSSLSARARRRLREHTNGNPLHVSALVAEVGAQLETDADEPLRAPRSFAALVLARMASCPLPSQRLLAAAAVLGRRHRLGDATRLAGVDDAVAALDGAVVAGLLTSSASPWGSGDMTFSHPLVRSAIYHDLSPARRAVLHARAATIVHAEGEQLRHRIAATLGDDAGLAAEAAASAERDAARGSWAAAAAFYGAAGRLSPVPAARERYTIQRMENLLLGGQVIEAATLVPEVESFGPSAYRSLVLGQMAVLGGDGAGAERVLSDGWELRRLPDDSEVAARIAGQLGMVVINQGRGPDTVAWGRRALELSPRPQTTFTTQQMMLLMGLGICGRASEGLAEVAWLPERLRDPTGNELDALMGRGVLRLWTDDLAGAHADLTVAATSARRRGSWHGWIMSMYYLADTEYRLGWWDDAITHAELAASLAHDSDQVWTYALVHGVAAFPLAARGAWEAAEGHAQAAAHAAGQLGDGASQLWAAMARARLAQARGDHAGVIAACTPLLGLENVDGLHEPGIQPWQALLGEALVATGQLEDAERLLSELDDRATAQCNPTARRSAQRLWGGLLGGQGRSGEAETALRAATDDGGASGLEGALARLAYGSFLRRGGKRRAAAEQLEAARRMLEELGAAPFIVRCDRELASCGLSPRGRKVADRTRLTPQELAVATLVASGLTNAQVAAELVVSVKTIEYHLGKVYATLGVTSRTRLALLLGSPVGSSAGED